MSDLIAIPKHGLFTLRIDSPARSSPKPWLGVPILMLGIVLQYYVTSNHIVFPGSNLIAVVLGAAAMQYIVEQQTTCEFDLDQKTGYYRKRCKIAGMFNMDFSRPTKFKFDEVRAIMVWMPPNYQQTFVYLHVPETKLFLRKYGADHEGYKEEAMNFASQIQSIVGQNIIEHKKKYIDEPYA